MESRSRFDLFQLACFHVKETYIILVEPWPWSLIIVRDDLYFPRDPIDLSHCLNQWYLQEKQHMIVYVVSRLPSSFSARFHCFPCPNSSDLWEDQLGPALWHSQFDWRVSRRKCDGEGDSGAKGNSSGESLLNFLGAFRRQSTHLLS